MDTSNRSNFFWHSGYLSPLFLSACVGLLIGLMPVTKYVSPVLLLSLGILTFVAGRAGRPSLWLALPIVQYCLIQFALNVYHSESLFDVRLQHSYVIMFLSIWPIMALMQSNLLRISVCATWMLFGLLLSTLLLASDYYMQWGRWPGCRVTALSFNPLGAAAITASLGLALLMSTAQKSTLLKAILLAALVLSVGAFNGARMVLYILCAAVMLISAYAFWQKKYGFGAALLIGMFTGLVATAVIDTTADCGFMTRVISHYNLSIDMLGALWSRATVYVLCASIAAISLCVFLHKTYSLNVIIWAGLIGVFIAAAAVITFYGFSPPAEILSFSSGSEAAPITFLQDGEVLLSESGRLSAWVSAFHSVVAHPFLGEGITHEGEITAASNVVETPHAHNQYLSWGIWGGIIGISSGLWLLIAPIIAAPRSAAAWAFSLVWALNFLTDSLLSFPEMLTIYFISVIAVERLSGALPPPKAPAL